MRLVLLASPLTDPRFHRRALACRRDGADVVVAGYDREDYVPGAAAEFPIVRFGRIRHGHYLQRLITQARTLGRVRRELRDTQAVWAMGLDMLLLAWLASLGRPGVRRVYEVADIRSILLGSRWISKLSRALERFLVRRTDVVVVTSPAYVSAYFHQLQGLRDTRFHLIENKLDPAAFEVVRDPTDERCEAPFRIGYFGLLRCASSLKLLARLQQADAPYEILLRGFALEDSPADRFLRGDHPLNYGGPYVNPGDLNEIYSKVDLGWIAHDHAQANTRWSRVNRFYECCLYGKPMIAQAGTLDAADVERLDLGCVIDLHDPEAAIQRLQAISAEDVARWRRNLQQLPRNHYTISTEHRDLLRSLQPSPDAEAKPASV